MSLLLQGEENFIFPFHAFSSTQINSKAIITWWGIRAKILPAISSDSDKQQLQGQRNSVKLPLLTESSWPWSKSFLPPPLLLYKEKDTKKFNFCHGEYTPYYS